MMKRPMKPKAQLPVAAGAKTRKPKVAAMPAAQARQYVGKGLLR